MTLTLTSSKSTTVRVSPASVFIPGGATVPSSQSQVTGKPSVSRTGDHQLFADVIDDHAAGNFAEAAAGVIAFRAVWTGRQPCGAMERA